jgi:hypothetical protein
MRVPNLFSLWLRQWIGILAAGVAGVSVSSCATILTRQQVWQLEQTAGLIDDVKTFGKTLGIEPTEALNRTARERPALSMLWLWMQREGTLALSAPIDIRTAIGYSAETRRVRVEQVYRVDGYSVYYRQGNEFADSRSIATIGFSDEPIVRRVKVVLHEDLHGDSNFAQTWEIEEGIVTPLGSLAAVEYFRWKGDENNLQSAASSVSDERQASRELAVLVAQAQKIFVRETVGNAKQKVLALLGDYPAYRTQFERQVRGQHAPTVLEAKLSHDLAYYRYFESIAVLAELAPSLKTLIADLKNIPAHATHAIVDEYLRSLRNRYSATAN